jgi:hypothetical protein
VWPLETVLVEILFGRVDHIPNAGRMPPHWRPAAMTERGRCEHLVITRQQWYHVLPHLPDSRNGCSSTKGGLSEAMTKFGTTARAVNRLSLM